MPDVRPPLWKTVTRGAILAGILCVIVGLAIYHTLEGVTFFSPHVLAPFGLGVILLVAGIGINWQWLLEVVTTRRSFVGLNVWAMVVLSALLLVGANTLVGMTPRTAGWFVDCSRARRHGLPPMTENVLHGLKRPVKITVLMGEGVVGYQARDGLREYDLYPDLVHALDLFGAVSDKVETAFVNFDRQPEEVKGLKRRTRIEDLRADSIVIESGDRHERIRSFAQLLHTPKLSLRIYENLTEMLLKVTEEKRATAYFLTGHGELATSGSESRALNVLVDSLKKCNYQVTSLDLSGRDKVPDDCDVLVIAGPKESFRAPETRALTDYLAAGGSLFALAFAQENGGNAEGLNEVLADFNVKVLDAYTVYDFTASVVVDPETKGEAIRLIRSTTFNPRVGSHAITKDFSTLRCEVEDPCPLECVALVPVITKYLITPLLQSQPGSTAVTRQTAAAEKAREGRFMLALAAEPLPRRKRPGQVAAGAAPGPRLVLVGSPEMVMDQRMRKFMGNETFAMNCMNWLARREYKLGIPPTSVERPEMVMSEEAKKTVFYVTVVCMPLAAALAGGFVFWIRRR